MKNRPKEENKKISKEDESLRESLYYRN